MNSHHLKDRIPLSNDFARFLPVLVDIEPLSSNHLKLPRKSTEPGNLTLWWASLPCGATIQPTSGLALDVGLIPKASKSNCFRRTVSMLLFDNSVYTFEGHVHFNYCQIEGWHPWVPTSRPQKKKNTITKGCLKKNH